MAQETESEDILNLFYARNEESKNGKWQDGWRKFCLNVKDFYLRVVSKCNENATERQKEFFAHYLDCEAHTDIWRELFPTWNSTNEK